MARSSYDDSYRNASLYRSTLASGRRVDERWNLWLEYAFERRSATPQMKDVPGLSGDAYRQDSHNAAAHAQYSLNESAFLAIGALAAPRRCGVDDGARRENLPCLSGAGQGPGIWARSLCVQAYRHHVWVAAGDQLLSQSA